MLALGDDSAPVIITLLVGMSLCHIQMRRNRCLSIPLPERFNAIKRSPVLWTGHSITPVRFQRFNGFILPSRVWLKHDSYSLCDWYSRNRMVLNANKIKSMLVTGKWLKSQINGSGLDLQAGGAAIEQVMHQKLLGVTTDEELTFKEQTCRSTL